MGTQRRPNWTAKRVEDLANQLWLARSRDFPPAATEAGGDKAGPQRQGRAVFLIGAGCSKSAGIPVAREVAQYAAIYLAGCYQAEPDKWPSPAGPPIHTDGRVFTEAASTALKWLSENGKLADDLNVDPDAPDWAALYSHFFESHLAAPNRQRDLLKALIDRADGKLNWTHVCLGELVTRGYVGTILTTNFDQLAARAVIQAGRLPVIADGLEALTRVLAEPSEPQIIYLHGSMHTYSPRNSRVAVAETEDDDVLPAVLYSLLHRSDILVVVGYAGGEEGVMQLLKRIARKLPSLVIYWVLYDRDERALSPGARELLSIGENKFLLPDQDSDELFRDLMNRLGIGLPGWISDPLARLAKEAEWIQPIADDDVAIAISRHNHLIDDAISGARDPTALEAAAEARLRGDYDEALRRLENEGDTSAVVAARAATLFKKAQTLRDTSLRNEGLKAARSELEKVAGDDVSPAARAGRLLLVDVLPLLLDGSEEADRSKLRKAIIAAASIAIEELTAQPSTELAKIQVVLGQALLEDAERASDKARNGQLSAAESAFRKALEVLESRSYTAELIEAKAGLASVLQQQGRQEGAGGATDNAQDEKHDSKQRKLQEAVDQFRVLVAIMTLQADPKDQAGRLENAAGALVELAETLEGASRAGLRREASGMLYQAEQIYSDDEPTDAEAIARLQKERRKHEVS